MDYEVILSNNHYEFEERVTFKLRAGWKLQGGVCVTESMGRTYYHQAMTKEK